MKPIDNQIKKAIAMLLDEAGSQAELAKTLGVSPVALNKWISGATKAFSESTWAKVKDKIEPLIQPLCWHGMTPDECILNNNASIRALVDNIRDIPDGITHEQWIARLNNMVTRERENVKAGR